MDKNLQVVISARDEASKTLRSFSGQLKSLSSDLKTSGTFLLGVGTATAFAAKGFIEAAGQMQATRTAFKVLIGDSKEAEATLQQLFTLEARTPFTISSILTESKKLLAMGTDAKDLAKTLTMLGDVAAGVGFEKLPQLTLAFGQIQAKGRLMGTELRQLTEAGFNLADAMGVSHAKLEEMIAAGDVGFEDVRAAFERVTGEGGRFNGMMDQLAQTTPGRLSTLSSGFYYLQAAIGEALLPAVNTLINALLPLMQQFSAWAQKHQELVAIIIGVILVLGLLGGAMFILGSAITGLTALFAVLTGAISIVTTVIGGLIALLGGPLTLIVLAIIAIVAVLALAWKNNWFGIRDYVMSVVDWFKNTALPTIRSVLDNIANAMSTFRNIVVGIWNSITGAINAAISAIQKFLGLQAQKNGGGGGGSFQHGGFIPGAYNQAVPAILHGGERVVPRNGVDVNSGGGSSALTINFSGPVSMDSEDRVQELADQIIRILGRQSELAGKGLTV